jgi:outer membrane immunogenic protein
MKKVILAAAAASILFTGAASAADMAVKARPAPLPVAVYNWTGFYIGAHGGGGWAQGDSYTDPIPSPAAWNRAADVFGLDGSGALAGVHAGYNWQVAPTWLLGVEADWTWTDINAAQSLPIRNPAGVPFPGVNLTTMSRDIEWLASIRGRAGWVNNNLLLYVTGGVAWGEVNYLGTTPSIPAGTVWAANYKKTEIGYVVGAGAEFAITPNLLLRAEYLYYRLEGDSVVTNGVPNNFPGFQMGYNWNDVDIHTGRVGLSYKFGGPVVAKY